MEKYDIFSRKQLKDDQTKKRKEREYKFSEMDAQLMRSHFSQGSLGGLSPFPAYSFSSAAHALGFHVSPPGASPGTHGDLAITTSMAAAAAAVRVQSSMKKDLKHVSGDCFSSKSKMMKIGGIEDDHDKNGEFKIMLSISFR